MSNIEVFTTKQTAEILGVTPRTIRNYHKNGFLPVEYWVGNRPRFTLQAIQGLTAGRASRIAEMPVETIQGKDSKIQAKELMIRNKRAQ